MYSYRKSVFSILMLVAVLLVTTITPVAFAKEPPITLRITNLSNYDELVLEDETLVEAIWNELPSTVPDESSVKRNIDKLKGLSKYVLQFLWGEVQGHTIGTMPPIFYYVDDGFPHAVAKKAFILSPDDNPSYIQPTNHTLNTFILNAYRSAVKTLEVTPPISSVIGMNQSIELDWKINGIDKFYADSSHTNIHCINKRPIEYLREKDWIRHYSVNVISDPIQLNGSNSFHGSILADSYGIYSCRVHVTDGYREVLSRIYQFEVLDLRELSRSESKGVLSWDKEIYEINDSLILTFEDPAFNKDTNAIDNVEVRLWTDTDRGGLLFILRETSDSSGIFREIVSFCLDDACGARLRLLEGDLITAYMPSTGAIAHARIAGKVKPADRISITSIGLVDEQANLLGKFDLLVNREVTIQTNITNNQQKDQDMRVITQIKDSKNMTAFISSKRMVVPVHGSMTIIQPWIPTEAKVYNIEVFIWQDFENPSPLAEPQILQREPRETAGCCRVTYVGP